MERKELYDTMIDKIKHYLVHSPGSTVYEMIDDIPEISEYYKYPKTSLPFTLKSCRNKEWLASGKDLDRNATIYCLLSDFDIS